MKLRFVFILILVAVSSCIYGQRILPSAGDFATSEYFIPNIPKEFTQITETNEKGDTLKIWKFNSEGQLVKEGHWYETFSITQVKGINIALGRPAYKEYVYHYLPNGKLETLMELFVKEADTMITPHYFDHSIPNESFESYRSNELLSLPSEFSTITKYSQNRKDTIMYHNVFDLGDEKFKNVSTEIWYYTDTGKLRRKEVFSLNQVSLDHPAAFSDRKLSSRENYFYDEIGRLKEIYVFFEDGKEMKFSSQTSVLYKDDSLKPNSFSIKYPKKHKPRKQEYILEYDNKGRLAKCTEKDDKFFYTYK